MQIVVSFSDLLDLQRRWHWVWPPSSDNSGTLLSDGGWGEPSDIWTICWILCWPSETCTTACFTQLRPSPPGWRRRAHKRRRLRSDDYVIIFWCHVSKQDDGTIRNPSILVSSIKIWCKKRAWRIGTHAEKVIGWNWASLRVLQQPPEMFWDILDSYFSHWRRCNNQCFIKLCQGHHFTLTISGKNNQNSTFQLSVLHQCFYCGKRRQPYCRIDGQEKLQLSLFIDRLRCNAVMILLYSIKFIYSHIGPKSSCKWFHKYRETFVQS